ncbi:MAG: hypothetical protein HY548_06775 [Elusimicrobia bacterium]|nr:hypothetical protein [Elusimicrobiota bacterium]
MPIRDVHRKDWAGVCDQFTNLHGGSLVDLLLLKEDGSTQPIALSAELRSVTVERHGKHGPGDILILLNEGSEDKPVRQALSPHHVQVRVSDDDVPEEIRIFSKNGTHLLRQPSVTEPGEVETVWDETLHSLPNE